MRKCHFSVLSMTFLLIGTAAWSAASEQESGKEKTYASGLVGSWSAMKGDAKFTLSFSDNKKFTLTKSRGEKSENFTGTYVADTGATPNRLDLTIDGGSSKELENFKGKTSLGIFKIAGTKLEWVANEPGKKGRPALFANKDGDKSYLYITLERNNK